MNEQKIIEQIKSKKDIYDLVNQVIKNPKLIEVLISTINSEKGSIKFGCEKIVRLVSEKNRNWFILILIFWLNFSILKTIFSNGVRLLQFQIYLV
jgi:hypothetical protein